MRPKQALSELVMKVKACSSKWINEGKYPNKRFKILEINNKKRRVTTVPKSGNPALAVAPRGLAASMPAWRGHPYRFG